MERLLDLGAYLNFVQVGIASIEVQQEKLKSLCGEWTELVSFKDVSVQAQYWQDPYNEEKYMSKSKFLADINQADGSVNDTYKVLWQMTMWVSLSDTRHCPNLKTNLMNLKNFVMVEFENDTVVQPKESEVRWNSL